ncbi:nitrate- and nitrite sensing domain-containing protein [Nocardia thailandica]
MSVATDRARRNRLHPRTIRGQLSRILAVSLILVLALLGVTVAGQIAAYRRSGDTADAVAVALAVQDLVHQAQRERGLSNGLLGGDERWRRPVAEQRAETDRALDALDAVAGRDVPGATEIRAALGHLAGLPQLRASIDAGNAGRQAAFQFYTDGITALNRPELGLDQARDARVRHGLAALYALGDAKEYTARERGFLNGVFAAGEFGAGEYVQFLEMRSGRAVALAAFAGEATPAQQSALDAVTGGEHARLAAESENVAIASATGPLARPVDAGAWWTQMTQVIDGQREVQRAVGEDVRERAAQLRREAALWLGVCLLVALAAVAVQIGLVVASLRAIVRPLAGLAAEADDVAGTRLPEVVAAWGRDADAHPERPAPVTVPAGATREIAAVADALDRVQATAVDLASAQALVRRNTTESLANLARRNQNLVRRQLGLISDFEREELDPEGLAKLFELDHLATRMRRNAESLLVLVGEAGPRRWAEPIPLTEVIRAALSEVDDYRRVLLRRMDDAHIAGSAVTDLAHLLAELIENGLAFSPPDLEVEVYGSVVPGGYLLAVVDHGVGMPAEQLAEANARLGGDTDFIVAPTRYLGHYVVGRLADRLDVRVELTTSPVRGIVARVLLPKSVLAEPGRREPGSATAAGGRHAAAPEGGDPAHDPAAEAAGNATATGAPVAAARTNGSGHHRRSGGGEPVGDHAGSATLPPDRARRAEPLPGSAYAQFLAPLPAAGSPGVSIDEGGHPGRDRVLPAARPTDQPATGHGAPPSAAGRSAPERTRNGLVKRTKRARPAAPEPAPRPRADRPPVPERTPEATRGMLSSFRSGHQRGGPGDHPTPRDDSQETR